MIMSREFKHKKARVRKTYTYSQTYVDKPRKGYQAEITAKERHERMLERVISDWSNRKQLSDRKVLKGWNMNEADVAYYDKRAAEYYRLKERREDLDPVKDYAEINVIGNKLACIRKDFEQLNNYSKIHNAQSYDCQKPE